MNLPYTIYMRIQCQFSVACIILKNVSNSKALTFQNELFLRQGAICTIQHPGGRIALSLVCIFSLNALPYLDAISFMHILNTHHAQLTWTVLNTTVHNLTGFRPDGQNEFLTKEAEFFSSAFSPSSGPQRLLYNGYQGLFLGYSQSECEGKPLTCI
jgi:hypothetical protein